MLQKLRRSGSDLPVLVLTARDTVHDRIEGLDTGADDYLVKPFDLLEVGARLRAITRRREGRANPIMEYRELTLDPAARSVTRDGKPVTLSGSEFTLLEALLRHAGRILTRERRFTANAAHELRTPLAALKTLAQAAQLGADGHGHQAFLEQIVDGVDRATHLLEQLLTLARVDAAENRELLQQQVDIHAVTLAVLATIGERALDKNIDLSMESKSGPIPMRGDRSSLEILLRNLVDNAIRYTPAGGAVTIGLEQLPDATRLTVSDTGPGIPPEQRQTLFQRFSRGDDIESPGSGLGLSIVAQIAALHDAGIELTDAREGHGLVVTVSFPA